MNQTNFYKSMIQNNKALGILTLAWLVFGLAQTAHYYFYFDQTFKSSMTWGFKNWLIWFILIYISYAFYMKKLAGKINLSVLLCVLAILLGALQIAIIIVLDNMFFGYDKEFIDGFWNLYKKRWFQNVLIFVILWFMFHKLNLEFNKDVNIQDTEKNLEEAIMPQKKEGTIKISDNKKHSWVKYSKIVYVEVTGNYLCFHTIDGQHISRGTLKELAEEILEHGFLRINRSCLINKNFVESYKSATPNDHIIIKKDNTMLSVSRRYRKQVRIDLNIS